MRNLLYELRMIKAYMHVGFRTFTEYPLDSVLWSVSMLAREATGFFGITLIAATLGGLGGWTLYEICILFGMAMIPEAIGQCCLDSVWNIEGAVRKGQMDMYFVRPLPVLLQLLCSRYNFQALITLFVGIGIVIYGTIRAEISVTIWKCLFFLLFVIFGTILNTSIYLIFNSLNFWVVQSKEISNLVLTFRQFAKYPLHIFPVVIEFCMTYVIPFGFVGYYPALYWIEKGNRFIPGGMIIASIVTAGIAISIWCVGIRNYNSTGT